MISVLALVSCVTTEAKLFTKNVSKERELDARVQIASAYLQDDQAEVAMRHLKLAMDINPESPKVHEVLALTLEKMGDDEKSVEKHFRKMLQYDDSYTRGRANYGSYLIRKGNYEAAYKEFERVVQDIYYPNRTTAYQQLGLCALKLNKYSEAVKAFERAIAIDNNYAPALYDLTVFYFERGEYPLSHEYFLKLRKANKKSSPQELLLGIKLSRIFKDKDEEASYVMALKNLYPRSQEYLEYLNSEQK